jgi:serine protease Do
MKISKRSFVILSVLTAGFVGGLIIAANLEWTPAIIGQGNSGRASQSVISPSARALADQLSDLFEGTSEKVSPSVMPIFSEQEVKVSSSFGSPGDPFRDFFGDDFFKHFFGQIPPGDQKQTVRGLGSGVIVSSDGYILTNNHVVQDAEKLTVVMPDKKKYTAKVIGTDPQTDVAVIKIDAKGLPAAQLGNSDNVKVGQWVIAVGNPFQLLHTVTAGIISAKGRSSVGLADYEDSIQTDASINPGNSGGALADLDGNVIGINTAISSPSGGSVGIGFAIPSNMAKRVMDELIDKGKISRGYLALVPQDIDENMAKALHLKSADGALVGDVTPDGPADKGGIKRGDIITQFDSKKVANSTELRNLVAQADPGSAAKITLLRDGKEMQVTVALGERPKGRGGRESQPEQQQPDEQTSKKLGLSMQNLTPDIAQQLGYLHEHGVVITDVSSGSPAEDAGLQQGDLIKEVNRVAVATTREFNRIVARLGSGESVALLVQREQNTFYVAIQLS